MEDLIKIINEALMEEFELKAEQMRPEAKLIEDLELDSLDFVDMVIVLQNAFNIKLRDEKGIREISTLDDLYKFISSKRDQLT
jgi:acyl carrier protein